MMVVATNKKHLSLPLGKGYSHQNIMNGRVTDISAAMEGSLLF